MTWSIIAQDKPTGRFGIAAATKFFAVGALLPHIAPRIGAIATQALINPFYGVSGLRLLREGRSASETLEILVASDAGNAHRQVHIMDQMGCFAAHTGPSCVDWCGHLARDGYSVAGNMLVGPGVLRDTAAAYEKNLARPFAQRLITALRAGEAAGGDKRGKQSAALVIVGDEEWPDLDLRVDDHDDPLEELNRLECVSRERFVHFFQFLPSRRNPTGVTDRPTIEAGIAAARAAEDKP